MDLKIKAHIGDALAALFARTLLNKVFDLRLKNNHTRYFIHSHQMISNDHFTKTCVRFNLFDASTENTNCFYHRNFGTRYEAHLYDIYLEAGSERAFEFFKNTAYKLYAELHEEMPILP